MKLSAAAQILQAPLEGDDRLFTSVSTDTRTLRPDALFVALQGPNFDGHEFLEQASAKGAAGALVSASRETDLATIRVADTRRALGRLAAGWRSQHSVPVVAVTGSNGKTTVKEMIAAILGQSASVLVTQGNLNNDIGMPLTLLRLQDERFAVLEMGANHPGEIAYLSGIAQPDVALITNAGAAHLEGFGDLDGVARAKGEIIGGLVGGGVAVLNADDPRLPIWRELAADKRVQTFGLSQLADVRTDPEILSTQWSETGFSMRFTVLSGAERFPVSLALAGQHNLRNALAAIAACQALGIGIADIQQGLAQLSPVPGRLQCRITTSGLRVIDDSYNANPDSLAAAIEVLRTAPGRRFLVLGDLAELGKDAKAHHVEVGRSAAQAGIDALWATGTLSCGAVDGFGAGGRWFSDQQGLIAELRRTLQSADTVLVKGSRSAAMERVVDSLLQMGED
ncbi:MAG: UDP-N-acetylmuramoyl-tripeptide--D-alanyl-D-alanine ligase [Gammaproteobacteria bacterium]|nr:UDP-N-acetylmuramoyl-tripeptide--D-alanyl-D-alanine ligase [Gammaproteobacteria bacterium]